jgi:hypothetical protein
MPSEQLPNAAAEDETTGAKHRAAAPPDGPVQTHNLPHRGSLPSLKDRKHAERQARLDAVVSECRNARAASSDLMQ